MITFSVVTLLIFVKSKVIYDLKYKLIVAKIYLFICWISSYNFNFNFNFNFNSDKTDKNLERRRLCGNDDMDKRNTSFMYSRSELISDSDILACPQNNFNVRLNHYNEQQQDRIDSIDRENDEDNQITLNIDRATRKKVRFFFIILRFSLFLLLLQFYFLFLGNLIYAQFYDCCMILRLSNWLSSP